jgi:hypothetical protein
VVGHQARELLAVTDQHGNSIGVGGGAYAETSASGRYCCGDDQSLSQRRDIQTQLGIIK